MQKKFYGLRERFEVLPNPALATANKAQVASSQLTLPVTSRKTYFGIERY
jgi:hypothetical protein